MREIKFRAWDKKSEKMRILDSISFHSECSCFDYDNSHLPKTFNLWGYDIISQEPIVLHREENEVILLQYTGLKDKHGKEIYEGDICKDDCGDIVVIVWRDTYQWACRIIKGGTLSQGLVFPLWQWDNCEKNGYRALTVIGNICENPELVEVQA